MIQYRVILVKSEDWQVSQGAWVSDCVDKECSNNQVQAKGMGQQRRIDLTMFLGREMGREAEEGRREKEKEKSKRKREE
jgi:hypothetical protein